MDQCTHKLIDDERKGVFGRLDSCIAGIDMTDGGFSDGRVRIYGQYDT